jgi:hypothetical protein
MAHAGFSVFFLLSLLAAAVALVRATWLDLGRIRAALAGTAAAEQLAPEFRLKVCPTAEVPRIARRLRVTFPEGLAPVLRVPRAWPFEREDSLFG